MRNRVHKARQLVSMSCLLWHIHLGGRGHVEAVYSHQARQPLYDQWMGYSGGGKPCGYKRML